MLSPKMKILCIGFSTFHMWECDSGHVRLPMTVCLVPTRRQHPVDGPSTSGCAETGPRGVGLLMDTGGVVMGVEGLALARLWLEARGSGQGQSPGLERGGRGGRLWRL